MMFGALCALAINSRAFEQVYDIAAKYVWAAVVFALVASPLLAHALGGAYLYVIGYTLEGACIALTMIWLIRNPASIVGRFLNSRSVVQVGVMSYSIYVWQNLFLDSENQSWTGALPFNLFLIGACAFFSYYLVEKPSVRLRVELAKQAANKLHPQ